MVALWGFANVGVAISALISVTLEDMRAKCFPFLQTDVHMTPKSFHAFGTGSAGLFDMQTIFDEQIDDGLARVGGHAGDRH